jgi:hypothetical protein
MNLRYSIPLLALLLCLNPVHGYMVSGPQSLDKLTETADIVFKGTATSSVGGNGKWDGANQKTEFKIVSVIKGQNPGNSLNFFHYDNVFPEGIEGYEPQHYHFEPGHTYLVFAKRANGYFVPLWTRPTSKQDQGAIWCADDKPVSAKTVKEAVWSELTGLLQSAQSAEVSYSINQLDQMSGGGWGDGRWRRFETTLDFDRKGVVEAVHGFVTNPEQGVAQAAIGVIGSNNPYMSEERAPFWLATVGSADTRGLVEMNPKMENIGGDMYWNDLVAAVDGKSDDATRALAIRALGLVRQPALEKPLERWLADPSPAIRSSATILLADFPDMSSQDRLSRLATDPDPDVRASAALSIGFGQEASDVATLSKLLGDDDARVRRAAMMSLLSFSPNSDSIAAIFKANLNNQEFSPLFLLALARENPAPYLDGLVKEMKQNAVPENWAGGETPWFAARQILFKYLQAQPFEEVTSGKMDRYLDAIDKAALNTNGVAIYIYAFYVQRGMTERAKAFRQAAQKAFPYLPDASFNQVDQNPLLYKGASDG